MTTTDFRVLCAEVIEKVEFTWGSGIPEDVEELLNRARAALAEPKPEGPTDEDLDELAWNWFSKTGSTWYQIAAFRAFARAVLARWGTPNLAETRSSLGDAPQPVPVSERPPGPEGLNDKGECWEWDWSSDAWVLIKPIGWTFRTGPWLPAHALPLPTVND